MTKKNDFMVEVILWTYYPPCQHLVPERSSLLQREKNSTCKPQREKQSLQEEAILQMHNWVIVHT